MSSSGTSDEGASIDIFDPRHLIRVSRPLELFWFVVGVRHSSATGVGSVLEARCSHAADPLSSTRSVGWVVTSCRREETAPGPGGRVTPSLGVGLATLWCRWHEGVVALQVVQNPGQIEVFRFFVRHDRHAVLCQVIVGGLGRKLQSESRINTFVLIASQGLVEPCTVC